LTSPTQLPVEVISSQSIFILVFGFGVGYITLYWAYRLANKLPVWHRLSDFDKAMRTVVIGGAISILELVLGKAPLTSNDLQVWYAWFKTSQGWLGFFVIILISVFLLVSFLTPTPPKPQTPAKAPTKEPSTEHR
jgi:sterol desaturase/sphingolipid hydroxylase (fatty acid hydroxylase superfamily)